MDAGEEYDISVGPLRKPHLEDYKQLDEYLRLIRIAEEYRYLNPQVDTLLAQIKTLTDGRYIIKT